MNKIKKYFPSALVLIILSCGLIASLILSRKRQEIRKQAAVPSGLGKITLNPQNATKYPGERFATVVNFRTGTTSTDALAISSVTFRITYSYSGTTPELDIVDPQGNPANQIYPDSNLLNSGQWFFPIKNVTRAGGKVTIDFAAANVDLAGFKSSTETPLATIYFKANRVPTTNPITLSFDLTESKMMTKADPPQDILQNPLPGSYTIQTDTSPPSPITNLTISSQTKSSLTLTWTAPADSGPEGKANSYELKYSLSPINDSNWSSATPVTGLPTPTNPGTTETFTVSGLSAGTTYYFGLKSTDASGNISGLSNIPSGSTSPATLSFGFKIQGVNVNSLQKQMEVTLRGSLTKVYSNISFRSDANGVFTPTNPIPLTGLSVPSGGVAFDILVKDGSHLRKKLGNITILPTDNVAPTSWNSQILKAGDFNNDNILKITDISLMLTVYTALSIPVTSSNQIYDVDSNNVININDISLVLANYTALEVPGE